MLLIARRQSESVIINGSIEVKVVEIKGNRVKLGFEYPAGNTVYREEIYQKIQAENRSAMQNIDTSKLDDVLKKFSLPSETGGEENAGEKEKTREENKSQKGANTLSPKTTQPTENKDE